MSTFKDYLTEDVGRDIAQVFANSGINDVPVSNKEEKDVLDKLKKFKRLTLLNNIKHYRVSLRR